MNIKDYSINSKHYCVYGKSYKRLIGMTIIINNIIYKINDDDMELVGVKYLLYYIVIIYSIILEFDI